MAKQKKEEKKGARVLRNTAPPPVTVLLEEWLEKRDKSIFFFLSVLTILFSFLLFNARASEGGDDATYIKAGYEYAKNFTGYYFSFNAPGYPMFLSLPISIVGLNLVFLKVLSVFFYFFGFYFLYKALRGRVRSIIFYPVMFILAVNAYAQYYASQTYNEAFYFLFQGLFFFVFFRLVDSIESQGEQIRLQWKQWLGFGALLFMLAFVKNVSIVALPAVVAYFLLTRKFISAVWSVAAYLAIRIPFEVIKRMIWGGVSQFSAQGDILKLKDPYDKSKGYEELSGYFGRLFDNINIYLGKRFWEILGFFGKDPVVDDQSRGLYAFLSKVVVLVLIALFIGLLVKKTNKPLLFALLYTGVLMIASFIALQARWDQPRIIIIFLPFLLLFIFHAVLVVMERGSVGAGFYLVFIALFAGSSLVSAVRQSAENLPVLSKNMKGDALAGYTPDWVNFLRMSRWCADNLPKEALVASRKAPMSFIYGKGKEFFPVYRVIAYDTLTHQANPDSVLAIFKKNKVTHVMLASIRIDPKTNSGQIINTMHNILAPVAQKYKDKVVLVHTEGETETCELYEIKY